MIQHNAPRSLWKKIAVVTFTLLLFITFFGMLTQQPWRKYSSHREIGTVEYIENPWVLRKGDQIIDDNIILPKFIKLETDELYSVTTTLTYDGSKDELPYGFLHIDHVYCRVYLDGELLFSYMPEDIEGPLSSNSPGFIYKGFALPNDSIGKELKIELLPKLNGFVEYGLPDVSFGDLASVAHRSFIEDLPHNIVVILCITLGIIAILFATVILRGSNYLEAISIGIFSLLFAIYLITESRFNDYYIGNPYYLYLLNYISFSLLPISLLGFMRERLMSKQRRFCSYIIYAELAFFVLEMFCHFNRIYDLKEFIIFVHMMYFADVALIIFYIFAIKDLQRRSALVFQLIPVIIGMIFDAIIYWLHFNIGGNDATFTIFGVIIFLVIELLHVWRGSLNIYAKSVSSSLYLQMAYIDELTAVGNRRAYDKAIDDIINKVKTYKTMFVVSADVNNLKYVNDTFGHAAGDTLIHNVAQIIREAIGENGEIFRTGGDEFAVFLYDVDEITFHQMSKVATIKIEEFNRNNEFVMSLASGYVCISDNNILDAVKEADVRMYANKAKSKI